MHYDYFIGMISQYETDRIKAYRGHSYRVTNTIPDAFGLLVPDIIQTLDSNIHSLCQPDQNIVILGLQPAGQMLESKRPQQLKRTYDREHESRHLCCTLDFQIVPAADEMAHHDWQKTYSVVIDFTAGEIMNDRAYLAKLAMLDIPGVIYGRLNAESLKLAWRIANIKSAVAA